MVSTLTRVLYFIAAAPCVVYHAHAGLLWPQPKSVSPAVPTQAVSIDANAFAFQCVSCPAEAGSFLQQAFARYAAITFQAIPPVNSSAATLDAAGTRIGRQDAQGTHAGIAGVGGGWAGVDAVTSGSRAAAAKYAAAYAGALPVIAALSQLQVTVVSSNVTLQLNVSEAYMLQVPATGGSATIVADTVFGALRGLERFSQLVDWVSGTNFVAAVLSIQDSPRFPHRGVLVDSSRHFLPLPVLLAFLDAMAYNMMNTFHWHIVDSQSFPYVSVTFPSLSGGGAWNAPATDHTYSPSDVQAVISYAYDRGIRVLVEFDTPGHSDSWGPGIPGLLTQCYNTTTNQPIPGSFGPIDPTKNSTWTFLRAFFTEVAQVFPDNYLHLGGDEVAYDCWESNPDIQAWMQQRGWTDYEQLENYYEQQLLDLVGSLGKSYFVWQDVFDNGINIKDDTVVHAWKGGTAAAGYLELANITAAGYRAILSTGWYLNYISYGPTWTTYYTEDPQNFTGTPEQKALVFGGEFAMWGEYVDSTNLIARCWPFGSAIAERLWSPATVTDVDDAAVRLHDHRCRMLNRGITLQPANGPAFCPREYVPPYDPPFAFTRS